MPGALSRGQIISLTDHCPCADAPGSRIRKAASVRTRFAMRPERGSRRARTTDRLDLPVTSQTRARARLMASSVSVIRHTPP